MNKYDIIVCARCGEEDDDVLDLETRICHSCGEAGVYTLVELIDLYNQAYIGEQ